MVASRPFAPVPPSARAARRRSRAAAEGREPEGAGQARRRPRAGGDGQAHVLGGLRVERDREEMAGLRGRLPRLRAQATLVSARRVLGGLAGDKRIVRNPQKIKAVRENAQVRGRHRPRARQLRQVPQPSGRPATRSACSSCWASAARGSAAARGNISCASSARTASSPRPIWWPACATRPRHRREPRPPRRT